MMSGLEGSELSVTYEELQLLLHRKIEELCAGGSDNAKKNEKKEGRGQGIQQKKRTKESGFEEKKPLLNNLMENVEKDVAEAAKELKFSHIKLGNEEEQGKKKKKKLSKMKELEKAKKLEEAKKDPEKAKKHSWSAAGSRNAGVKVQDNPKLLEQSLKKDKKSQEKNAKKWKERVENQKKLMLGKQQKRSENIAEKFTSSSSGKLERERKADAAKI